MKVNYIQHKIANLISIHKIVSFHYYELNKDFFFEGESHNFWEIVFVDAGHVEISTDNCVYHLKQGNMIFHKPNEFHTLKADQNSAANVVVVSFVCSSESMRFFKGKICTVPQKLKKYLSSIIEEAEQTFDTMQVSDIQLKLKENPPIGGQQMVKTLLEQFLILLIRSENNHQNLRVFPSKESMENHLVTQMIALIDENIYKKINVEQICKEMKYSRAYLSKIFKQTTGYTLLEYTLIRKIKEAKKLIREERYNFTQISDMLCFDNPHYFSRVFRRITNMTPTEYKNSVHLI